MQDGRLKPDKNEKHVLASGKNLFFCQGPIGHVQVGVR